MAAAPCCAPTKVNSLKFLSLTVPTSVTTPIFRSDFGAVDAGAEAEADASADAAVVGAADVAGDVLAVPLLQAATKMDSPANRASPVLRMRMCPPPDPKPNRPRRSADQGSRRQETAARPGRPLARILATGGVGRQARTWSAPGRLV